MGKHVVTILGIFHGELASFKGTFRQHFQGFSPALTAAVFPFSAAESTFPSILLPDLRR